MQVGRIRWWSTGSASSASPSAHPEGTRTARPGETFAVIATRRHSPLAPGVSLGVLVCAWLVALCLPGVALAGGSRDASAPGSRGASAPTRTVRYDGYHVSVPASWPVLRLAAHPRDLCALQPPCRVSRHAGRQ